MALHEASTAGSSELRIGDQTFLIFLSRAENRRVVIVRQEPLDDLPLISSIAVVDCLHSSKYLKPGSIQRIFEELSGVAELKGPRQQAGRRISDALPAIAAYRKLSELFHGRKARVRALRRSRTKLLRNMRYRDVVGNLADRKVVQQSFASLDVACKKYVDSMIYTDIIDLKEARRRAWHRYMHARIRLSRFRDAWPDMFTGLPEDPRNKAVSRMRKERYYRECLTDVRTERDKWKKARDKAKQAEADVKRAQDELQSRYQEHVKIRQSFIESGRRESSTTRRELCSVDSELSVLQEEIRRYNEAREALQQAQWRAFEERKEARRLDQEISQRLSMGRTKFSELATKFARLAFDKPFEAISMSDNYEILIERRNKAEKHQLPSEYASTSERDVLAFSVAAAALAAYRPNFPFIVCFPMILASGPMDRLARGLSHIVGHVIYRPVERPGHSLKVVHCH
jgi:DNA repair exonuclease SbcCD ATPase subunit